MPDLALSDITLHYEIGGDGPPLLMLAGMLSDSASWGPIIAHLEEHHTVIRPDNRTTGRTTPWDAPTSVGQMTRDARALMHTLGHERFHLVGHSMGGLMAMELAGGAQGQIASLTILASAPVRIPRTMAVFDTLRDIRASDGGEVLWLKALYPWVFQPAFFTDPKNIDIAVEAARAYPHAQTLPAMALQIEALRNFEPATRPSDITCPTHVLFAEHDLLIPEGPARAAFSAIPNVQQTTVADAGHSIHWDAPEAVTQHILSFTRSHPI